MGLAPGYKVNIEDALIWRRVRCKPFDSVRVRVRSVSYVLLWALLILRCPVDFTSSIVNVINT